MSLDEELPLEVSRKIDELCLEFEARWRASEAKSIDSYLNRWNDSMATGLEDEPLNFAENNLASTPWDAGKHKPTPA